MEATASSQSTTSVEFFAIEADQYLDDFLHGLAIRSLSIHIAISMQRLAKVFREGIHFYSSREFIWKAKKKYQTFQLLSIKH